MAAGARDRAPGAWRHRFALLTSAATLFLIFAGGMVTSTGSGLAVPDWPLSYGQFFPPMVGGVFYEHGHRMVAATVGFLTLALAVWTWIAEPRRWVRWFSAVALTAVVVQAILGGITVLYFLPTSVSVSHAGLANLFLCMTVFLVMVTGPGWNGLRARSAGSDSEVRSPEVVAGSRPEPVEGLVPMATITITAIYVQILLGALMRHTGSGLAIPDFPLALGRIIPPLGDPNVAIHVARLSDV